MHDTTQQQQKQRGKPLAMHQFAKPRHNKLQQSLSSSTSSSASTTATAAPASGDPFGSFFSKFTTGWGSNAHQRGEELEISQSGASMYTPLEWSCRGPETPEWDVSVAW
jgi:hypothetical protein